MTRSLSRRYLLFTVFVSGWVVLTVEIAAARLLGAFFGTGNLVWATIIGLILVYLTVGYYLGGALADRWPCPRVWFSILAWAGLGVALLPLVSRPVLVPIADAFETLKGGLLLGAFLAVVVLFAVPVTLLGVITPFALRLDLRHPNEAGRVGGRLYAISTLGSLLGTFAPVLVWIPWLGTRRTLVLHGAVLVLVALEGLRRTEGLRAALRLAWMLLPLAGLWLWAARAPLKPLPGLLYETESTYNYIYVVQRDELRMLYLNEGLGVHSVYHPRQMAFQGTWMHFLPSPFLNPPPFGPANVRRMAIIGLAGGTVAHQAAASFPGVEIHGFEIDPAIVEVARRYFALDDIPNLKVWTVDGRVGIRRQSGPYDLIVVDAYRPPDIPWHLTTVEFFTLLYQRLSPQGAISVNVGRTPTDRRLVDALAATLRQVFPVVYGVDIPNTLNTVLYAAKHPQAHPRYLAEHATRLAASGASPLLVAAVTSAAQHPSPPFGQGWVLTDDRAAIEYLTNLLVVRYAWESGIQTITSPEVEFP